MKRLGVNIDHIATLRNARNEIHPDPVYAAKFVKKAGADSITIHLREDRRHIKDLDAKKICSIKGLFVNLEISTNLSNLSSGTGTIPIFGSIVQNGKFSACALLELVNALNKVDLPTLGNPTIPHLKPITCCLLC